MPTPVLGDNGKAMTSCSAITVLAGAKNDWVVLVMTSNGVAEFDTEFAALEDSKVSVVRSVMSTDPGSGGDDVLLVADGDDIVIGGFGKDLVNYVPIDSVKQRSCEQHQCQRRAG